MSLYFSSAVDIAVLTMGENPREAQDAPSASAPRCAMSEDKLQVGSFSIGSLLSAPRCIPTVPRGPDVRHAVP